MMKIRLNLLNQVLAGRFTVSSIIVSNILNQWIPSMAVVLRRFVVWPIYATWLDQTYQHRSGGNFERLFLLSTASKCSLKGPII